MDTHKASICKRVPGRAEISIRKKKNAKGKEKKGKKTSANNDENEKKKENLPSLRTRGQPTAAVRRTVDRNFRKIPP